MVSIDALYRIANAAEEAGNHDFARQSYERGAALGDAFCVFRLAHMYDVGELGVSADNRPGVLSLAADRISEMTLGLPDRERQKAKVPCGFW